MVANGCMDAHHSPGKGDLNGGNQKLETSFSSIEANIIRPLCIDCHSGTNPPHGILLTSYEAIVNSPIFPPLIIPKKPLESSLYKSVLTGQMPRDRRKLNQNELQVIYNWILSGAPQMPPSESEPPCGQKVSCQDPCDPDEPCDDENI